jgi:hypothetical protein
MTNAEPRVVSFRVVRILLVALAAMLVAGSGAGLSAPPTTATAPAGLPPATNVSVAIDAAQTLRKLNPRLLGGSNVAAWTSGAKYASPALHRQMADLAPGVMRLPGGSWGDIFYWNGHGVRGPGGKVDPDKVRDGYPDVDYTDYAPSFLFDPKTWKPSAGWHGNIDAKGLHDFVRSLPGCATMVIVNAGTGRPVDAAEWVRWANRKMGYAVRYWEVGNELDGSWEAGHALRQGGELTPAMYAQRYKEFAQAMKAVDPTIKVGGAATGTDVGGFTEAMLRDAGEYVDFVSVHLYPGNPMLDDQEQLTRIQAVADAAKRVKQWIAKYQPARGDKIELGITEWNLPDYRGAKELYCGLWSEVFLCQAALTGYDLADQWEWEGLFEPAAGGAARSSQPAETWLPRSQYWALWLWNNYVGDRLVAATPDGFTPLHTLASRSDDALNLMFVNTDPDREARVKARIDGFAPAAVGEKAAFSAREYFWNELTGKIEWSTGPKIEPLAIGPSAGGPVNITVPPYAIVCVRIPSAGKPALSDRARQAQTRPAGEGGAAALRIILPAQAYAGDKIEGWVLATSAGTNRPYPLPLEPAALKVEGSADAKCDCAVARLAESAGRFHITPSAAGEFTVTASAGDLAASAKVAVRPSEPQPRVFWLFEQEKLTKEDGYESDWPLTTDSSVRANQRVARVDLPGEADKKSLLLRLTKFPGPDKLARENIRGVIVDLRTSADFACADPNAAIEVVMQSPADYWMSLGRIPLAKSEQWQTRTVTDTQDKHLKALPFATNVSFILRSNAPVKGAIFLDKIGFMVR